MKHIQYLGFCNGGKIVVIDMKFGVIICGMFGESLKHPFFAPDGGGMQLGDYLRDVW